MGNPGMPGWYLGLRSLGTWASDVQSWDARLRTWSLGTQLPRLAMGNPAMQGLGTCGLGPWVPRLAMGNP